MASIAASHVVQVDAPSAPLVPLLAKTTPIVFVVPAFDEERNLPRLLSDLEARPALFPPGSRLIVVDDGSRDRTAAIVDAYAGPLPVELVRLPQNLGPGAAFRAGLVLASWVMVNVSRLRRVLSDGAALIVRRVLGIEAHTVSSFFRVYRASCLRRANARYGDTLIREPGFACKAELLAKLAAIGARIEEVPVGLDTSRR